MDMVTMVMRMMRLEQARAGWMGGWVGGLVGTHHDRMREGGKIPMQLLSLLSPRLAIHKISVKTLMIRVPSSIVI